MTVIARNETLLRLIRHGIEALRDGDGDANTARATMANLDQLASNTRGAVQDRDHFERALERIFHGSEDHAWEDARKALDTRPSRRGQ